MNVDTVDFGIPRNAADAVNQLLDAMFPILKALFERGNFRRSLTLKKGAIGSMIHSVIEKRKKEKTMEKDRADFLQLIVDAEATDEEVAANPHKKKLTQIEIFAHGFIFFIAGYETTASTLQYLSYLLAMNPDKQEKLYSEIVAAIGDAEPSYENVSNIPYLDCFVREALRYFPATPMFGRRAAETRTIKGVTIPAGSVVITSIYGLTRDKDFFPDPEKFIPERFEADREKIPTVVKEIMFGAGPRQCIGMRLALYEVKMATVSVVRKFKFVKVKDTPETIRFQKGNLGLSAPEKTILVGTQLRE